MAQSLAKVIIHIIFRTKNGTPWLRDPSIRDELHKYMTGNLSANDSPSIAIGGIEDHVHLLCLLSRKFAIKTIIEDVKKSSSRWIKTRGCQYQQFYWQKGYGVFSVSPSDVAHVQPYILNQEEHHKNESFQDKFRRLCEKNGIAIDERYVWD